MFRPAALFIGMRYTRAKRRNHFISFISLVSMMGIALGIAVLITVLSVMNGFDREIKKRVFSMVPPITVSSATGTLADWSRLQALLKHSPEINDSAPFITAEVLLNFSGSTQPAVISGILPDEEKKVSEVSTKMIEGELTNLQKGQFGIVLGENLASALNAKIGDKITVVTPQVTLSPAGVVPRFKRFVVVGVFKAGNGFGFDRSLGFVALNDAQKLLGMGENVSGLHLSIQNVFAAPRVYN